MGWPLNGWSLNRGSTVYNISALFQTHVRIFRKEAAHISMVIRRVTKQKKKHFVRITCRPL